MKKKHMKKKHMTMKFILLSIFCIFLSGNVRAAELETTGLEAIESESAECDSLEEILQENTTSIIIPMDDTPALQLDVSDIYQANPYNDFKNLKLPAQITQQGNYYFIVDTYNNQVLYASDLWKPTGEWRVMDRNLNKPHAIASDGSVYLVADTDNNRVLCYEYVNGRFQNTQAFDEMGTRPHYIQYGIVEKLSLKV